MLTELNTVHYSTAESHDESSEDLSDSVMLTESGNRLTPTDFKNMIPIHESGCSYIHYFIFRIN